MRSNSSDEGNEVDKGFIMPGSVCTIAASESSSDSVWFIKIKSAEEAADERVADDYGNIIMVKNISLVNTLKRFPQKSKANPLK